MLLICFRFPDCVFCFGKSNLDLGKLRRDAVGLGLRLVQGEGLIIQSMEESVGQRFCL